jgi:gluconokinase/6-phosphogluconolactonase
MTVDQRPRPDIIVAADPEAMARAAVERVLARLPHTDGHFTVCLTGGSTSERLYELLATRYRDAVPWPRIKWFWGDDRFVPESDPRSNAGAARRLMLGRVPVPPANICAIPIGAENVMEAARLYELELQRHYGGDRLLPERPLFDIVLMGMGGDGHTASLFPGHDAELGETERWVIGVPHAGMEPFVPRVTLTFPALASTREMLFLVCGFGKRDMLARVFSGADLPAARAWSDGGLVWLVDEAAMPTGGLERRRPVAVAVPSANASATGGGETPPLLEQTPPLQPKAEEAMVSRLAGEVRTLKGELPSVIIVMGVAGSGKSTIGAMLAQRLGWRFEDADWFHPPANIEKMRSGQPLTDADRMPWLSGIAAWIKTMRTEGGHGVLACSALKRSYRDMLVDGSDVRLVYLKGDRDLIARRFSLRQAHFMPASLIHSQFTTLEEPGRDERPAVVSIDAGPRAIVEAALMKLGIDAGAPPDV